ncbi:MAG: hypothetical protein V5A55_02715 [Halovenus sp.]
MDTEAAGVTAPAVDRSMLLPDGDEFETQLEAGVGPLAVVGPPFAGRERLLDRAATVLDARRVRLTPGATSATVRDALDDGPLVIENGQHLYSRQVGGFAELEAVLDCLVGAEGTVVTGWNSYAWSYLDAVRNVATLFADTFEVRELSGRELAGIVRERATALPTFRNDELDAARRLLEEALVTSSYVHVGDDHPVSIHVQDRVSYRRLRGRAYVADLRDEQAFASDVTRRSLDAFEAAGIETPDSPPLHELR